MITAYYQSILPLPLETKNYIKLYGFVEKSPNKWVNGFTEIRKLGNARYTIRHDMSKFYHVSNHSDLEIYIKNFARI